VRLFSEVEMVDYQSPKNAMAESTDSSDTTPTKKILVIEDEADIQVLLDYNLRVAGFSVIQASDGEEGLLLAVEHQPDLILLDWMLPLLSGIEILRQIRNRAELRNIPVIMLTAKGEEPDRLRGLNGGADDYITKPFSVAELLARVHALLRRASGGHNNILSCSGLGLDIERKRVMRDGQVIHVGPIEFRLLEHFLRNQGRVYSRSQLLDSAWGGDVFVELRTVDVHIRRLRKAININNKPDLIRTVRSMGYSLEPPAE
jgi:two-component system phosphate regulon response regulator PhoB